MMATSVVARTAPPRTRAINQTDQAAINQRASQHFISLNWRGRPLATYETIISLIAGTTTSKGLKVSAELDTQKYPVGVSASKHDVQSLALDRASFHGEWNYTLRPRTKAQRLRARTPPSAPVVFPFAARREHWLKLIGEQMKSGLNGRDFCRSRGITYGTYASARQRLVGKIRKYRSPAD